MLTSADPNDSAIVAGTVIAGTARGRPEPINHEDADCVLAGLTMRGAHTGIYCDRAAPTSQLPARGQHAARASNCTTIPNPPIRNCIIAGNRGPGMLMARPRGARRRSITPANRQLHHRREPRLRPPGRQSDGPQLDRLFQRRRCRRRPDPASSTSVTYGDIQGGWPGDGNLDADPCFARTGFWYGPDNAAWIGGDYHLQSQAGRWDADAGNGSSMHFTSPCLNAGNSAMGVFGAAPNGDA